MPAPLDLEGRRFCHLIAMNRSGLRRGWPPSRALDIANEEVPYEA